jgi:hypothetical protein
MCHVWKTQPLRLEIVRKKQIIAVKCSGGEKNGKEY